MSRKLARRLRNDSVALLKFERAIADLTLKAYRAYLPIVQDAVLPSLTAAITDPLPPDLNQIVLTQSQWDAILDGTFMPGIEQLMAERIGGMLEEEGVDWEEIAERQKAIGVGAAITEPITPAAAGVTVGRVYAVPSVREWQMQYLGEVRNRMVNTPSTVFRDIAADLNQGIGKGEGIDTLRKRVQAFLDAGLDDWSRRAETVARTEATGAFNGATLAANHARQELFGIVLEKVWVATIDSRTRKTHFAADGQRRALDAPFRVGKSNLRYPGDPRGRAEEVINCRCTTIELEPDEELPGETDRQTERAETNATVRNRVGQRVGDIQGEVDRRREDEGVVRARDDDDGEGFVAAAINQEDSMARKKWKGTLAPLGTPTGDGRIIKHPESGGKIGFRDFPLPLSWQKVSAEGHLQSVIVGAIVDARVDGDSITAEGFLLDTPESEEAANLLAEQLIRPSLDPSDVVWEMVDENGEPVDFEQLEAAWMAGEDIKVLDQFAEMRVMGATLVDHPAFAEAFIELDGEEDDAEVGDTEDALLASVGALVTERGFYVDDPSVFEDPGFTGPTGLHIDENGRVLGHIAIWGTCHVGSGDGPGQCRQPPHSMTDYALFHVSEVGTPSGPLAVGKLTVGGGHAEPRAGLQAALEHYDNACSAFALVRAGEDDHGIWVSGIAHPNASKELIAEGISSPASGDWRRRGGNLELIAALAVNTPGFPVPRGYRNDDGQEYSLVASGAVRPQLASRPSKGAGSVADLVNRAAALAAENAVKQYVAQTAMSAKVAATVDKIVTRRRDRAAALAARLRGE